MRIAVMGAGGVGGYLGAKLARAGTEVAFIARGAHLEAMRARGLRISGAEELVVDEVTATDETAEIGAVDAVLFCVKLYDTDAAARLLPPLLHPETFVVTLQNGVESAERIGQVIGAGKTLAGAAYFPASIAAPGEIVFRGAIGGKPLLELGEAGAGASRRCERLAGLFTGAGISARVTGDSDAMLWEKFCWIAGVSGATTITRQDTGTLRADPDMRWLFEACVAECAAVGRARGVALDPDLESRLIELLDDNPARGKASQLVDLERGRPLELEGLSGAVHRLGREAGVRTPVTSTIYAALKPFVTGGTRA